MAIFIRTIILYTAVVIVMRLMGKRQIGQLQPYELAVAIMISEVAAIPMQDINTPVLNGLISIITILLMQGFVAYLNLKSTKIRRIVCGKPIILVERGKILENNLRKESYTLNELLEQLRINGYPDLSTVYYAILETNGQMSIIPKTVNRPVTPKDITLELGDEELPVDLIIDGSLQKKNLALLGLTNRKLMNMFSKYNIKSFSDVFFASMDSNGNLIFQLKEKVR